MQFLQLVAIAIALISLLATLHLSWAWFRFRTHPHIESIEIAEPSIAIELKQLVAEIATIAGVPAPPLYIRRAAMPNAFVVTAIFRSELYLTDELLEHCNELENGLEKLTLAICHEIAHIQRGDALRVGLLTYGLHLSDKLSLKGLGKTFQSTINDIESETQKLEKQLMAQLS